MKKQLSIDTYVSSSSSRIIKKSLSEYTRFLDTCDKAWKTFQYNDSFNNNLILLSLENSQDKSAKNLLRLRSKLISSPFERYTANVQLRYLTCLAMIEEPPIDTFNAWLSAIKYNELLDSEKIRFAEILSTFCKKNVAFLRSQIHVFRDKRISIEDKVKQLNGVKTTCRESFSSFLATLKTYPKDMYTTAIKATLNSNLYEILLIDIVVMIDILKNPKIPKKFDSQEAYLHLKKELLSYDLPPEIQYLLDEANKTFWLSNVELLKKENEMHFKKYGHFSRDLITEIIQKQSDAYTFSDETEQLLMLPDIIYHHLLLIDDKVKKLKTTKIKAPPFLIKEIEVVNNKLRVYCTLLNMSLGPKKIHRNLKQTPINFIALQEDLLRKFDGLINLSQIKRLPFEPIQQLNFYIRFLNDQLNIQINNVETNKYINQKLTNIPSLDHTIHVPIKLNSHLSFLPFHSYIPLTFPFFDGIHATVLTYCIPTKIFIPLNPGHNYSIEYNDTNAYLIQESKDGEKIVTALTHLNLMEILNDYLTPVEVGITTPYAITEEERLKLVRELETELKKENPRKKTEAPKKGKKHKSKSGKKRKGGGVKAIKTHTTSHLEKANAKTSSSVDELVMTAKSDRDPTPFTLVPYQHFNTILTLVPKEQKIAFSSFLDSRIKKHESSSHNTLIKKPTSFVSYENINILRRRMHQMYDYVHELTSIDKKQFIDIINKRFTSLFQEIASHNKGVLKQMYIDRDAARARMGEEAWSSERDSISPKTQARLDNEAAIDLCRTIVDEITLH